MRDGARGCDKENIMGVPPFVVTYVVIEDMVGLEVSIPHEFGLVVVVCLSEVGGMEFFILHAGKG